MTRTKNLRRQSGPLSVFLFGCQVKSIRFQGSVTEPSGPHRCWNWCVFCHYRNLSFLLFVLHRKRPECCVVVRLARSAVNGQHVRGGLASHPGQLSKRLASYVRSSVGPIVRHLFSLCTRSSQTLVDKGSSFCNLTPDRPSSGYSHHSDDNINHIFLGGGGTEWIIFYYNFV